jgi:hypothetical protein
VNCPGSTIGLGDYEDESDEFASEGTAAHSLLTQCLRENLDPLDLYLDGVAYNDVPVSLDMAETVAKVASGVRTLLANEPYELSLDERVHASNIHDDCWGTLDMALYSERKRHLFVIDYKHGAGIEVFAEENEQVIIYGNGKALELELLGYEVTRVSIVISQPRHRAHNGNVFDLWEVSADELKRRAKRFKAAIEDGKTLKAGKWCRLCPKSGKCATQDAYVGAVIPHDGVEDYANLAASRTPGQIAEILDRQDDFKHWFAAVYRLAYDMAMLGEKIPGYTIKDTRKNRVWTDEKTAEKELHARFGDVIYQERVMRSPAQMEEIKGAAGLVAKHTKRPPGGKALKKDK